MQIIYDIEKQRKPIKVWTDYVEAGALEQAINLSNLPFLFKHVALMPDVHQGYGMPIGGVIACEGVVIPNAVGVDIGCGMCAVKTNLRSNHLFKNDLEKIVHKIKRAIPVGFNHHKKAHSGWIRGDFLDSRPIIKREYQKSLHQIGTLGGGNHFIEVQKGDDGYVWIMIHSGSRNLGYKVAKHYNEVAKKLNSEWFTSVPAKDELAFLPIETDEAKSYMTEMQSCVDFALVNRSVMMEDVLKIFIEQFSTLKHGAMINIAHNYAVWENHYGRNVMVHRKGTTLARKGTIGIIPGSQGTSSYIVKGLGNPLSFNSCSHGAGRKLGRTQAKKTLVLQEEIKKLNDLGIIHGIEHDGHLDEAPGAYKDIETVMENQKDLVKIKTKLTPMAVIKG